MRYQAIVRLAAASVLTGFVSCGGGSTATLQPQTVSSCMLCHNGTLQVNYAGTGIENPHPFGQGSDAMDCVTCHGGNPNGVDEATSHVPPPPQIGDRANQQANARAYFNRLTLAGIDTYPDYVVNGVTYKALDYLQFIQPGDLRVVNANRSCGVCHANHAASVATMTWSTQTGLFGGFRQFIGVDNAIPAQQGLYDDTASDYGVRPLTDPNYVYDPQNNVGSVQNLIQLPVRTVFGQTGGLNMYQNSNYDSTTLGADLQADNQVMNGSRLENIYMAQLDVGCGNCHLGSAGANNRYGDFRGSGCTACHMHYSEDGKSRSLDPNVSHTEPVNPDNIAAPEVAHVRAHRIDSVAKTLPNGMQQRGIDDWTCAGCHQNANRDVMQFWGIRLDQNQDVRNGRQYPANPVSFQNTANDTRLFDPAVGNNTFNGRNANQYLAFEDYDGDGRDDTPPDVHYDAGMGCIDCHTSYDLHGGDAANGVDTKISSHMEGERAITCESCHGTPSAYAATVSGTAWDGTTQQLCMDSGGHALKHVVKESDGNYYLYSKLTGAKHYCAQAKDVVVNTGKTDPNTLQPVYNDKASYAMGRDDGDPSNGTGPHQTGMPSTGFAHTDNMNCATCHASWSNTCVGCHLKGRYNEGNNFSNITGERIVYQQTNADFTYESTVPFQLGVDTKDKINLYPSNTKVYYQFRDKNNVFSQIFASTDRHGDGNNPNKPFGSLGHNALLSHSIRGHVTATKEGPRYCVACHLTTTGMVNWGTQYAAFRTALQTRDYGSLDFNLLKTHIGKNPGNQLNSPFFVHMVAGLGSGMFCFNADGGPVNPLDTNANRVGSNGIAPSTSFDPLTIVHDLDRIVDETGFSFASNTHSMLNPGVGPNLRDGALDPWRPGPLGATLTRRLTDPATGIVLDSWIDADGMPQGDAAQHIAGN